MVVRDKRAGSYIMVYFMSTVIFRSTLNAFPYLMHPALCDLNFLVIFRDFFPSFRAEMMIKLVDRDVLK